MSIKNPEELIQRVDKKNSCVPPRKLLGLWEYVKEAPEGDILEIGSWRGGTSLMLAASAEKHKPNSHVYICDTFEGIVKVTEKDNFHKNGDFGDTTSKEVVEDLMAEHNLSNVTVHKGIFPEDTGGEVTSTKIAFIHIDVDVYKCHIDIFNWMEGKLVPGAIIAFDDYLSPTCEGATLATDEYFKDNLNYDFFHEEIPLWPGAVWHKARAVYHPKVKDTVHAIVSLNDEKYQPLSDITWNKNKLLYAQRHGYGAICKIDNLLPNISIGYQKIHFVRDVMRDHPEYDWIWWTGTDSMITNFAARIEDRIDNDYHFIICVDVNGLNADSFLVRNTREGRAIIDDILSIEEEATKHWDSEQRAMAMIMGLPVTAAPWPISNHVPINEKYASIVKVVPQRFMNSYNYQMYHYTDHRDKLGIDGNWRPGDWLIHWPSASLDQRIQLSRFYMQHIVQ